MIFDTFKMPLWSILFIIMIAGFYGGTANAHEILIGTSNPKTFSYFTGRLIEGVINKQIQGISCKTLAAAGDIHNLTNLQQGSLDIALIDSRMMHDAINKTGNFKFIDIDYQTLQILTPLYDVPLTLIVGNNSGISNLEDLKGKRINVGAPLSIEHLAFETILTVKHWSNNHFSMVAEISDSQSQDSMAFCHGTIDAMIHIGVHPDPSLTQLFRRCNAKIANMNDTDVESLITRHPSFLKFVIPSGTYPSQKTGIITFATQTYLVTSQTLDGETAYKILEAIYKNRKRFSNGHPSLVLEKTDIKQIADTGLKLHAGALKYFSMPQ